MSFESDAVRDARIDVRAVLGAVLGRLPRILLVTLALLVATFVLLMFQKPLYESSASILVEPRSNVYTRSANEQAPSMTGGEAGVVSSQIALIRSRDTLIKVIDELDLRSKPEFNGASSGFSPIGIIGQLLGRKSAPASVDETVLNTLNDRLAVAQEKDSRIITVSVTSADPQLASDIANAVARAHVVRRAELSLSDTAEASGWLGDEIAKLRVTVNEAETAVANFKVQNDLFVGANNTSLLDQQLSTISSQISAAQERKSTALSRAALIRGMLDRGQPIDGVADAGQSTAIQQLSQQKAQLQSEKAQRSATLLENHPIIRALNAQIAEIDSQITQEGRRVAQALESEAEVEAGLEASLQADMTRAKSSASTATTDTVTLDGLEREAKAQRDLLEGYLLRYSDANSRTDSNSALPDVRVVSIAAPAVTPSSPKTTLVLTAVGLVSLLVQAGLVVFGEVMSGRAIIPGRGYTRPQDELEEVPFQEAELEPDQRWEEPEPVVEDVPAPAVHAEIEPSFAETASVAIEPAVAAEQDEGDAVRGRFIRILNDAVGEAEPAAVAQPQTADLVEAFTLAEPVATPVMPQTPKPRLVGAISAADLASDVVLGRTHLLILAAHQAADCAALAEELVGDALSRGLSVALVDAGTGQRSEEPGLTDLSRDAASFGDVVHKSADNSFAEVPWGQGTAIDRHSSKPLTLVEALGDIYEVVVLLTGRVGMGSSLPLFDGLDGRLVLVADEHDDYEAVTETRDQLVAAGFDRVEIAAAPGRVAA